MLGSSRTHCPSHPINPRTYTHHEPIPEQIFRDIAPPLENNATQHDAALAAQLEIFWPEPAVPVELASGSSDVPIMVPALDHNNDDEAAEFWAKLLGDEEETCFILCAGFGELADNPMSADIPETLYRRFSSTSTHHAECVSLILAQCVPHCRNPGPKR